jgi:beta-galactosidase
MPGDARRILNFNPGWRRCLGDIPGAEAPDFDDSSWDVVHLPDGLELVPENASGGRNYQGLAWYRKRFRMEDDLASKKVFLHFEAVMGKSEVWVDGRRLFEKKGGYLPFTVDVSPVGTTTLSGRRGDAIPDGAGEHVVAVRADNSDDPTYPVGKPQGHLDFTYMGGMYRDVWMVVTDPLHVSDPIRWGETAGGGVFVHCENVGADSAEVLVRTHVRNEGESPVGTTTLSGRRGAERFALRTTLLDAEGATVAEATSDAGPVVPGEGVYVEERFEVRAPNL